METEVPRGDTAGDDGEPSMDQVLEELLVEDAEIAWDPVTGKPKVARRPKIPLDRAPGNT